MPSNSNRYFKKNAALFLDRDGVINFDYGYVYQSKNFRFIPGIFSACLQFIELGYQIFIITNQSGIARGYYSEQDFKSLNQWMLAQFKNKGVAIEGVYYCPHHADKGIAQYKINCDCRKPKPGMILQAAKEHAIDLSRSLLVGDKLSDIKAGKAAGVAQNYLVRTGKKDVFDSSNSGDGIFDNLSDLIAAHFSKNNKME